MRAFCSGTTPLLTTEQGLQLLREMQQHCNCILSPTLLMHFLPWTVARLRQVCAMHTGELRGLQRAASARGRAGTCPSPPDANHCRAAASLPWAVSSAPARRRCARAQTAIRVCPGAPQRNSLLFSSVAYELLRLSAVCSDSLSASASAGLLRTCLACLHEQKRGKGGFQLGSARPEERQNSPHTAAVPHLLPAAFSQAGLAHARGAASGSHAGRKALTGKHLKHRPGRVSLPADPW